MQQKIQPLVYVLRLMALVVVAAAAVVLFAPAKMISGPSHLAAWMLLAISLGGSVALLALSSIIRRERQVPPELTSSLARLSQQMIELQVKMNDLHLISDRPPQPAVATQKDPQQQELIGQIEKIRSSLVEIRDISMLPDADRRARNELHRKQKKSEALRDLFGLVAAHEWPKAERLLITLETEYPNDDEIARGRSYLNHSRKLFEDETIVRSITEIEELVAGGAWDRTMKKLHNLVEGFPHNSEVQVLRNRVEREYEIANETNAQRLFDGVRHSIEDRAWRTALAQAQRMISQFPRHRLTEMIHDQLHTLEENAEIEQRQEMEIRIQEYIRDGHLNAAVELGEDLMQRYPRSPQAESLRVLLPKLRERAMHEPMSGAPTETIASPQPPGE